MARKYYLFDTSTAAYLYLGRGYGWRGSLIVRVKIKVVRPANGEQKWVIT